MAMAPKFLRGLFLLAFVATSVASEDCIGTIKDGVCSEPHEDDVALIALRSPERRAPGQGSLAQKEAKARRGVNCLYPNDGTSVYTECDGNQCCPGVKDTENKTYPCPNAQNYTGCQTAYPVPPSPSPPPASYKCPYASITTGAFADCAGVDECCPRAAETSNKTYPCPSNPSFGGCETTTLKLVQEGAKEAKTTGSVVCPYPKSGTSVYSSCDGAQCCPGATETQDKTYPCPNNQNYDGCQSPTPLSVSCPYVSAADGLIHACVANQCCPRPTVDGKTYPCPSSPNYAGCESGR